jgi:hypothetical protein
MVPIRARVLPKKNPRKRVRIGRSRRTATTVLHMSSWTPTRAGEGPLGSMGGSCIHSCHCRLVGDRCMCNACGDCLYVDGEGALPPRNCGLTIGGMGCFGEKYRLTEAACCLIGLNVSNHRANCRLLLARGAQDKCRGRSLMHDRLLLFPGVDDLRSSSETKISGSLRPFMLRGR